MVNYTSDIFQRTACVLELRIKRRLWFVDLKRDFDIYDLITHLSPLITLVTSLTNGRQHILVI